MSYIFALFDPAPIKLPGNPKRGVGALGLVSQAIRFIPTNVDEHFGVQAER